MQDKQISLSKQPVQEDQDHQIKSISPPEKLRQLKHLLRRNISTNSIPGFIELCGSIRIFDVRDVLREIYRERTKKEYVPQRPKPTKKIADDGDYRRGM